MQTPDEENEIFNIAASFIRQSNHPIFLTGKAGTGKTTFLKYIREQKLKNTAVVAPTGVAAINAGGTTIHSFFSLPLSPFIPGNKKGFEHSADITDKNSLLGKLKLTQEKKEIFQQLELLVIDEISMVRCDVLDAIDTILRHTRHAYSKAFGGVQVLYIGDMYQLPPVVKDEEWQILKNYYINPFFFSSYVCNESPPVYIELQKVYRQSDETFIALLNQVRNNEMDESGYTLLHNRYTTDMTSTMAIYNNIITLTTHNYKADTINEAALNAIPDKEFSFKALIEGDFYEKSYPAEENLRLKKGAQVMFLKNDMEKTRRYFNGKIGVVANILEDKIEVSCDNGRENIEVRRDTWKTLKYSLNKSKQHIEEEELGSFTQFPLRLAWAITIHKSQGLTFEKAIIDAGQAFAPGQVYVALSRCTSLEGLFLKSKITYTSLQSDERIVAFAMNQEHKARPELLERATALYQQEILENLVNFSKIHHALKTLCKTIIENFNDAKSAVWIKSLDSQVAQYIVNSEKFLPILHTLILGNARVLPEYNDALVKRMGKAAIWFGQELKTFLQNLEQTPIQTDNRALAKEINTKLQILYEEVNTKIYFFEGIKNGFKLDSFLAYKAAYVKKSFTLNCFSGRNNYVPAGIEHPNLYLALKEKRDELCDDLNLPVYMICSSDSIELMTSALPQNLDDLETIPGFGKHRLKKFGNDFLHIIQEYCALHNLEGKMKSLPARKTRKTGLLSAKKTDTKKLTYDLFRQGKNIIQIAKERNLAQSTIEGHLTFYIETGNIMLTELIEEGRKDFLEKTLNANHMLPVREVKTINPDISYTEMRWILAAQKYKDSLKN